jgi:hypothetical protein
MEAASSFETVVNPYQTTWHSIPQGDTLQHFATVNMEEIMKQCRRDVRMSLSVISELYIGRTVECFFSSVFILTDSCLNSLSPIITQR